MSRIAELPKQEKEDWQKELDENRYVQEGIRFEIQDAVEEAVEAAVKEASEKSFNEGYQEGVGIGKELGIKKGLQQGQKLQLQQIISQFREKGLTDPEIRSLLNIDSIDF